MNPVIKISVVVVILFILGCVEKQIDHTVQLTPDDKEKMKQGIVLDIRKLGVDEDIKALMDSTEFDYVASLKDITGGVGSGTGFTVKIKDKFLLKVDTRDLTDPSGTDFYEGWIIRKGIKFNVISTGRLEGGNGVYFNRYASEDDLTDHRFYVVTLEPDDGNPAPAEHILEGLFEPIII